MAKNRANKTTHAGDFVAADQRSSMDLKRAMLLDRQAKLKAKRAAKEADKW